MGTDLWNWFTEINFTVWGIVSLIVLTVSLPLVILNSAICANSGNQTLFTRDNDIYERRSEVLDNIFIYLMPVPIVVFVYFWIGIVLFKSFLFQICIVFIASHFFIAMILDFLIYPYLPYGRAVDLSFTDRFYNEIAFHLPYWIASSIACGFFFS